MSQFNNQYRFYLESTHRITLKYDRNDDNCNIIFTNDTFNTSNQLNKLISIGLDQDVSTLSYGIGSKTANIKFKIPCVGYFNSGSTEVNKILPEAFIKHIVNPHSSTLPFDSIVDSYDMQCNLLINGKLEVEILKGQESFRIRSFIKSNIWVLLPSGKSKFRKGDIVDCFFQNNPNKFF